MIFYEEVYDKINEDYLNGEISYEMAEAANDLAYNSYITVEEAENAASAHPDQGKVKSLLSKFASKLSGVASKCNVLNNAFAKLKGKTDTVEQNIGDLNANGGKCADGKVENPKKSIKDFVNGKATSFKALPTAGKAAIGVGLAAGAIGVGVLTYKEYKKHEDAIKAAIKKLQQELVKIAGDAAKLVKEFLSITNWKTVAAGAAAGAAVGAGVGAGVGAKVTPGMNARIARNRKQIAYNPTTDLPDEYHPTVDHFNKQSKNPFKKAKVIDADVSAGKFVGVGAGTGAVVGAGVGLISSAMINKKMKQVEKESGVKTMISRIIAAIEAFANKLGVALDKATTTMFAKFKKSK